jgi:aspartate 1-decarboxylase
MDPWLLPQLHVRQQSPGLMSWLIGFAFSKDAVKPSMTTRKTTPLSPTVVSVRMAVAKLHAVTVTQADLHYVGSITIDEDLIDAAGIVPFQMVQITNQSTGAFWQTYVIAGERGSGIIGLNGAPARHFLPGDKAYVVAEGQVHPGRLGEHVLNVVFVDAHNRVVKVERQAVSRAAPLEGSG